jgi:hypothetical protein
MIHVMLRYSSVPCSPEQFLLDVFVVTQTSPKTLFMTRGVVNVEIEGRRYCASWFIVLLILPLVESGWGETCDGSFWVVSLSAVSGVDVTPLMVNMNRRKPKV